MTSHQNSTRASEGKQGECRGSEHAASGQELSAADLAAFARTGQLPA